MDAFLGITRKMKQKTKFEDWYCKKCGGVFPVEIEADETTTKVWCSICHKRMFRMKPDSTLQANREARLN